MPKNIHSILSVVIKSAKEIEAKQRALKWSEEETLKEFVSLLKSNKVPSGNWFSIDDEIRKQHESDNWFWMIRRVRNLLLEW